MQHNLVLFFLLTGLPLAAADLADLPDPLVGTDSKYELSHGNTYPAVFVPFATANWTAQTGDGGWQYQYFKDSIRGFRLTHLPSAWTIDWGSFSLMPVTGELKVLPDQRASKFRHADEVARAYRYSVLLPDYQTRVEMAPSRHGGILRFTFPRTDQAYVVIDANPGGGSVEIHPETNTITGTNSRTAKGTASNFAVYFVAVFDRPIKSYGTWDVKGAKDTERKRSGPHVGAYAGFSTRAGEKVTVRIGTSLIGLEQAERNLAAEIPEADLDKVAERARAEWERELGKIEIQGGTEAQRKTFYTAFYHSRQFPRMLDEIDANGAQVHYSPYDGKVHPGPMMSDVGFWDVFRAQFPLLTIVNPKKDAEIIRALVNIYDEAGWLPTWPDPVETNVMIGTHADSVIADAYSKGIRDFDAEKAYAAIRKDGTEKGTGIFAARRGIEDYLRLGYVPADRVKESAASTLEYAYDDFCIAQLARALGKQDDYRMFMEHSKNYRNLWDPSTGFMRGKNSDGTWVSPFDPLDWGGVFTEGNAWQWLWSVQQDVAGLIELMGGKEAFIRKLDTLFTMTTDFKVGGYKELIHEMTEAKMGNMGQYAHINEPVHHVIYLYDYVGQPWKAQKWVHEVMDRNYKPGPAGWLGDEDNGQMSAWYILTAMGFYPPNPGQPIYALGSPLFARATIHLENGKTFTVEAAKGGAGDIYVQSATLNGKPLDRVWIKHDEIAGGGVLRFKLGPKPNEKWATGGIPAADR
jgi:predicted alpha-1,2-mannosidase